MKDIKILWNIIFSWLSAAEKKIEKLLVKIGATFISWAPFVNDESFQFKFIPCASIYVTFH